MWSPGWRLGMGTFPVTYCNEVIVGAMASHITSLIDQSKHQSSASLAFVRGIHLTCMMNFAICNNKALYLSCLFKIPRWAGLVKVGRLVSISDSFGLRRGWRVTGWVHVITSKWLLMEAFTLGDRWQASRCWGGRFNLNPLVFAAFIAFPLFLLTSTLIIFIANRPPAYK